MTDATQPGQDRPDRALADALPDLSQFALVGRGGFATVWRAWEAGFHRYVAVKVLDEPITDANRHRFEREARAIGQLSGNSSIVTVHRALVTADHRGVLVMEYCTGGTLESAAGQLPPGEALRITTEVGEGLRAVHEAGLLHLDVKPANILVAADRRHKLSDFGLARHDVTVQQGLRSIASATPAYAPPELLNDGPLSPATDVWMLAATYVALATGRPPFSPEPDGVSLGTIVDRITRGPSPDLIALGLPPAVAAVLERAFVKDPARRTASVRELVDGLAAASASGPAFPPPAVRGAIEPSGRTTTRLPIGATAPAGPAAVTVPPGRARRRTLLGVLAALVAIAVVIVAAIVSGRDSPEDVSPTTRAPAGSSPSISPRPTDTAPSSAEDDDSTVEQTATTATSSIAPTSGPSTIAPPTTTPAPREIANGTFVVDGDSVNPSCGGFLIRDVVVRTVELEAPAGFYAKSGRCANTPPDLGSVGIPIPAGARRLQGTLVLDDNTRPAALVGDVEVLIDGVPVSQHQVSLAAPLSIDLDVTAKRRVDLHVVVDKSQSPEPELALFAFVGGQISMSADQVPTTTTTVPLPGARPVALDSYVLDGDDVNPSCGGFLIREVVIRGVEIEAPAGFYAKFGGCANTPADLGAVGIPIPAGATVLRGTMMLDDSARPASISGLVEVLVDGVEVAEQQVSVASELVLDVDVSGARRVDLHVVVDEDQTPEPELANFVFVDGELE